MICLNDFLKGAALVFHYFYPLAISVGGWGNDLHLMPKPGMQ